MSIPLVQEATKDAINTSIIAIKRNVERINMLLGLVDSDSPDLSGFATKQELQDAVESLQPVDEVTLDNMQSVTSNAVAVANSYSTSSIFTGKYWIDGKKVYRKVVYGDIPSTDNVTVPLSTSNVEHLVSALGIVKTSGTMIPFGYSTNSGDRVLCFYSVSNTSLIIQSSYTGKYYAIIEYTKTTD